MANIVTSAASLGTPSADGAYAGLRLSNGHVEWLIWDLGAQIWRGRPHFTMRQIADYGQSTGGSPSAWKYPGSTREAPGYKYSLSTAFGIQIHKVIEGGALYNSGLRLQENLSAFIRKTQDLSDPPVQMALAWYPLAVGTDFLSPESFNHGVRLNDQGIDRSVSHWVTSGWQRTPDFSILPAPADILYPELYLLGPTANFRNFTAKHRWVYGPGSVAIGTQPSSAYPVANLIGWFDAKSIPLVDGSSVDCWADQSGVGNNLIAPASGRRPIVMTQTGRRFVRFDGIDDKLVRTDPGGGTYGDIISSANAPLTVFLVMNQTTGGNATQMWLMTGSQQAMMIYHGNSTNQINVWAGLGGDWIAQGSGWGSWKVYSIKLTAAGVATVWENLTPLTMSGGGGTTGFGGFTLGNSFNDAFPASIDIAEVIVCWRDMDNTERTNVVNSLRAKHNI